MTALFATPPKPIKPPGPSQESLDLQAAQKDSIDKQNKALDNKESEEKRKKQSRDRVVAQRRGTRGLGTLFEETGSLGVKLGGQGKASV
uniref:Uncharacterized protein n=1 Tax=uncultured marine virus TaxID=186617 RepID=A0A0F7L8M8_9VIRU|nr:hypothetical protein [uncultured marine virus]